MKGKGITTGCGSRKLVRDYTIDAKSEIAYQNKDVASKTFTELFPKESFEVYGIHLPRIRQILPTNLPVIEANELRIDNIFVLEDGSYAIIDYESDYSPKKKLKYLEYVVRVLKRLGIEGAVTLHMIVLYTADVTPEQTDSELDVGALRLTVKESFLSQLDSEEIRKRLTSKIRRKEALTDKELMEFVILPLTYAGKEKKQRVIEELFSEVKQIEDEKTQVFLVAGVMVFADKVIDKEAAERMKRWIMMTKVAKLFEEEKEQAVLKKEKEVTEQVTQQVTRKVTTEVTVEVKKETAKKMKEKNIPLDVIRECTGLKETEIVAL